MFYLDRQYYVKHIVTNFVFFVVCMKRAAGTVKKEGHQCTYSQCADYITRSLSW